MLKIRNLTFFLLLGFYMIRKGKISRGAIIDFCKARLQEHPHEALPRRVLAWIYAYGSRDYAKAAAEYKKLVDQGEQSFELYKALAFAQRNVGDFSGAIAALEQAERLKSGDLTVLSELGYLYMRVERYAEALDALEKALRMGHPEGRVNHYMGFCFLKLGDYERAIEEYEKALKTLSRDEKTTEEAAMAHTNLAIQFVEDNKWELAKQEFRKAIKLSPSYSESLVGLSKVMLITREFGEALELGNEIISKNPSDYRGYLIVSSALMEQGRTSGAIEICERGRLQANDPDGHLSEYLKTLYRSLG
jgi:tetratricopeptide (TPR) repeat protein